MRKARLEAEIPVHGATAQRSRQKKTIPTARCSRSYDASSGGRYRSSPPSTCMRTCRTGRSTQSTRSCRTVAILTRIWPSEVPRRQRQVLAFCVDRPTGVDALSAGDRGAAQVLARVIARDAHEREEAARVLSLVANVMMIGPLLAPLIGGQCSCWAVGVSSSSCSHC